MTEQEMTALGRVFAPEGAPLDDATTVALKAGIKGEVDGAITRPASFLVQPLGSDIIVVRPNGAVFGSNAPRCPRWSSSA